jgi:hypothetical protein
MMDEKAGKAVRSEIHSPEARGVSSAVWVQERVGHEDQGSSPRPEHPVKLPGFGTRCKVLLNKDHTTCGKERFIRNQTTELALLHP